MVSDPFSTGADGSDRYYCYDNRWQLTNIKTGGCTGTSVVGLGYDERGNLANKNGQAYVFDHGNRLRAVPGHEDTYRYDAQGLRILSKRAGGLVTVSMYSRAGQRMYEEYSDQTSANEYVYLAGSLLATRSRNWLTEARTLRYQHTDALGTPVAETDTAGNVVQRSEYDPYGRLNNRPLTNGPGYTGHYQDAATGLTYMQQRYYDSTIGRFLSMDAVTADANTGVNFNRYWYANNNPYRFIDPDGRQAADCSEDCVKMRARSDSLGGGIRTSFRSQMDFGPVTRSKQAWPTSKQEINTKDKPGEGGGYFGDCRGRGCSRTHKGIDANGDTGSPIFAFRDGKVIRADNRDANGYGNQIIIQHDGGIKTRYAHLDSMRVSVGDLVGQDDRIGEMGRSGNTPSQGDTHMHFEVVGPNGAQDPLDYFPYMKP